MNATEILLILILFALLVVCWLLWEVHQKLHRMHELNWQSFLAFENLLKQISKKL